MSSVPTPDLARIPAGSFLMGSTDAEHDERPVHRVSVGEFSIGRFPITQDEYARFVRASGRPAPAVRTLPLIAASGRDALFRTMSAPYEWDGDTPPAGRGGHPVVLIKYEDAAAYCAWLGSAISRTVRLPTEAEWEKAARGGAVSQRFPWGNEMDPARAHHLVDPTTKAERGTRQVGTCEPNPFGLYDMAGNVWEWVADWYGPEYYAISEPTDPVGPLRGEMRIVRGGSWVNADAGLLRCAYRHKVPPDTYSYSIGFRIVCTD